MLDQKTTEALLLACGEIGFRHLTLGTVADRYGGDRDQFCRDFANLGEAYAAAYESEGSRLCDEMLRVGAEQPTWRQGLDAALQTLARLVDDRPMIAQALLIDVHIAGKPALDKRNELHERLSDAVDSARRGPMHLHSPPPLTAAFVVNAIEAAAVSALLVPESQPFSKTASELGDLIVRAYFGDSGTR